MAVPTNAELKAYLESGVNVILAPDGEPYILCEDGSVRNKIDYVLLQEDDFRASLYAKYAGFKGASAGRLVSLGAPALADDDALVKSTNMKVGAYTLETDADPDVPRNILVTAAAGDTADTMGTITVTGTDYDGNVISEVITPSTSAPVAGKKAFKTVTSVVGAGWAKDEAEKTNDTIKVGYGNEIGLPFALVNTTDIMLGILGTTITACNPTVTTPASLSGTTIDMSAGTYNGTKEALVFLKV